MGKKKEKFNYKKETLMSDNSDRDSFIKKNKNKSEKNNNTSIKSNNESIGQKSDFQKRLENLTQGLIYISETDSKISPFLGDFADGVTIENLQSQIKAKPDISFQEIQFEDFFRHPVTIQDWFNSKRIKQAKKYRALKTLLENNLRDLRVFKIGKINLDIYVVGLDINDNLVGIKTKATET